MVAALLALVASASSREELSADKAVEAAAPPSVCGEQCQNKYDVKVRERPLSIVRKGIILCDCHGAALSDGAHLCCLSRLIISGRLMFFRAKKLRRNRGCIIFSSTSYLLWMSSLA